MTDRVLGSDDAVWFVLTGRDADAMQSELLAIFEAIPGLDISIRLQESVDASQVIYLAGAVGSIIQALHLAATWWAGKRAASQPVDLHISTASGAKLDLDGPLPDAERLRVLLEPLRGGEDKPT